MRNPYYRVALTYWQRLASSWVSVAMFGLWVSFLAGTLGMAASSPTPAGACCILAYCMTAIGIVVGVQLMEQLSVDPFRLLPGHWEQHAGVAASFVIVGAVGLPTLTALIAGWSVGSTLCLLMPFAILSVFCTVGGVSAGLCLACNVLMIWSLQVLLREYMPGRDPLSQLLLGGPSPLLCGLSGMAVLAFMAVGANDVRRRLRSRSVSCLDRLRRCCCSRSRLRPRSHALATASYC